MKAVDSSQHNVTVPGFKFQVFLSEGDTFHGLGWIDQMVSFLQGLSAENFTANHGPLSTL